MSEDLDWGRMPEDLDYSTWKYERNCQEASRPPKPPKR